jgi:transposase
MGLYLVSVSPGIASSQPVLRVPCRCCPDGISRSSRGRCYPSDMTDAEWAVIEPLLPAPGWLARRGGSPGTYCRRDLVDAIRYLVHNGCVWRALPADLPHWRTVYGYVRAWHASGATRKMHDELRGQVRMLAGRSAGPGHYRSMAESVYQSDPGAAPDSDFLSGRLEYLVAGNRGRLLDPRRTPVRITQAQAETGFFEVEIGAFEDAGARWLVPLESSASYQFAPDSVLAGGADLEALRDAVARCDVQITVTAGAAAREHARARLAAERSRAGAWLTGHGAPAGFDPQPFTSTCSGWPDAQQWLSAYLDSRGLGGIEEDIAAAYVSNPWSGDLVLGHLIVIAELGLGALTARAPRDPEIFAGRRSKPRRAEHILARMGFVHQLWSRARGEVMLHRGIALQNRPSVGDSPDRRRSPLISASFSEKVAASHFRSPAAHAAALYRQRLVPERLFMTFLETAAMSRRFREAEAVVLATGWQFPSPPA